MHTELGLPEIMKAETKDTYLPFLLKVPNDLLKNAKLDLFQYYKLSLTHALSHTRTRAHTHKHTQSKYKEKEKEKVSLIYVIFSNNLSSVHIMEKLDHIYI